MRVRLVLSALFCLNSLQASADFGHSGSSSPRVLHQQHEEIGLIPEILQLENGQQIPDSVLEQNSPNAIARSIVERLSRQSGGTTEPAFLVNAEVHLFFPRETLDSVVAYGLLSMHITRRRAGREGGSDVEKFLDVRLQVENGLSGLNLSAQSEIANRVLNRVRPKSAYLLLSDSKSASISKGFYGDLIAIPKDELRSRMTWTPTDSFAGPRSIHATANTFQYPEPTPPKSFMYYEAQIWGDVNLKDLKEIWVPINVPADVIEKIIETGIPLYYYEDSDPSRAIRGDLVGKKMRVLPNNCSELLGERIGEH